MEAIQVSQGMKMGRRLLLASTAITLVLLGRPAQAQMPPPDTTPQGGTVVGGAASIARAPGAVTITQSSPRAAIDWRSAPMRFCVPSVTCDGPLRIRASGRQRRSAAR